MKEIPFTCGKNYFDNPQDAFVGIAQFVASNCPHGIESVRGPFLDHTCELLCYLVRPKDECKKED